jgi:hypothetical protein
MGGLIDSIWTAASGRVSDISRRWEKSHDAQMVVASHESDCYIVSSLFY